MKKSTAKIGCQRGFTMMEIIAVLVIMAIVALVVVGRMQGTSSFDAPSQMEVIKAHLRLAQFRAISANTPFGINFSSSTTYYLFNGAAPTTPVLLAGENDATVSLTTKKSSLTINSAPQVITFNAYGIPVDASNVPVTANTAVATSGGNITITKNTGFIP